jgi:uncharacterized membrane protein YkoI
MRKTISLAAVTTAVALTLGACGGSDDETLSAADREKASSAAISYVGGGAVTDAERGDGDDKYAYQVEVTLPNGTDLDIELDDKFKVLNSPPKAADFPAEAPSGSSSAAPEGTTPSDDNSNDDQPLTGKTLTRASEAALAATKGGKVTETSGSDEADHAYEVDVLLPSGEDVTVELDDAFAVTRIDR